MKAENFQKLIQLRSKEIDINATVKNFEQNLKLKSENLEIRQAKARRKRAEKTKVTENVNACVKNVSVLKA